MLYVINMKLKHEQFGEGTLKEFKGNEIVVRFEHGLETLPFPKAFEMELKTTNEEDEKKVQEMIARWKPVNDLAEQRDRIIMSDARVDVVRAYDEKKRQQKEDDRKAAEERVQKKRQYLEEAQKASAEAAAKKAK